MSDTIEADLSGTANETIRVPRNIMGLLRRSYDSREKVLDWMLAIFVALAAVYFFRDQIMNRIAGNDPTANAGRVDPYVPSQAVSEAIPPCNETNALMYTYNLPRSRTIKYVAGPSATGIPTDPSQVPSYPTS